MMTQDEIRAALEQAVGVPEAALLEAVAQPGAIAPPVIAVARAFAGGRMPLPHEERLLRFGLYALSVARETSVCPALLALLRLPGLELDWLFSEYERATRIARLLLGLYDGDDAAIRMLAADPSVDDDVRAALLEALARLVWDGRASRDGLTGLLDRFDREELAGPESFAWYGWQNAIQLLGLIDWRERVERAWGSGRQIPMAEREVDRQDWLERTQAAADDPQNPQRFIDDHLMPYDDPVDAVGWSADAPGADSDPLTDDEWAWLHVALWRGSEAGAMCLEWADGFLTALAVGPQRIQARDYLPAIMGTSEAGPAFDSPEHDALVARSLSRWLTAIERQLAAGEELDPWIERDVPGFEGMLWAAGYMGAITTKCLDAWAPLRAQRRIKERLMLPVLALMAPDPDEPPAARLSPEKRLELIDTLPLVLEATYAFWRGEDHPLIHPPRERAKVGRNDPCPCGSGKKYKRCCAAVA
jgi:yecA family protein